MARTTTQTQLLHSARMASLGQMAAGVAHELNQPRGGAVFTLLLPVP